MSSDVSVVSDAVETADEAKRDAADALRMAREARDAADTAIIVGVFALVGAYFAFRAMSMITDHLKERGGLS